MNFKKLKYKSFFISDKSHGVLRRMLLVSFLALFVGLVSCVKDSDYEGYVKFFGTSGKDFVHEMLLSDDEVWISGANSSIEAGFEASLYSINYSGVINNELTSGNNKNNYLTSFIKSGNFIYSVSNTVYDDTASFILEKRNDIGIVIKDTSYSFSGFVYINKIIYNSDGELVLTGYINQNENKDILLMKIASDMSILWSKTYGGSAYDEGIDLIEKESGGYVILCNTSSFYEPGQSGINVMMIETDAMGYQYNMVTYGGVGNDYGVDIKYIEEKGYIVSYTQLNSAGTESKAVLFSVPVAGLRPIESEISISKSSGLGNKAGDIVEYSGDVYFTGSCDMGDHNDLFLIKTDIEKILLKEFFGGKGDEAGVNIGIKDEAVYISGETEYEENRMISLIKVNLQGQL